ncbi:hypothetical protein AA13594_3552 [Gluconacetobacter azotocaptans DSM 13594]|nr:hypothetical protein AA13594_3552 [Gluconacetobacter azotocaptans DSM 13594]
MPARSFRSDKAERELYERVTAQRDASDHKAALHPFASTLKDEAAVGAKSLIEIMAERQKDTHDGIEPTETSYSDMMGGRRLDVT